LPIAGPPGVSPAFLLMILMTPFTAFAPHTVAPGREVRLSDLRLSGEHRQHNEHQLTRQGSHEQWLHHAPNAGFFWSFCPIPAQTLN
jgi:hypothetical protein